MSSSFPSFEAYVEAEGGGWGQGGKCSACMTAAPRLTKGIVRHGIRLGQGDCERCLRYHYGHDQAEAKITRASLYGTVRSLIEAEVPPRLIREAVDAAIDDLYEADAEKAFQVGLRAAEGA